MNEGVFPGAAILNRQVGLYYPPLPVEAVTKKNEASLALSSGVTKNFWPIMTVVVPFVQRLRQRKPETGWRRRLIGLGGRFF